MNIYMHFCVRMKRNPPHIYQSKKCLEQKLY